MAVRELDYAIVDVFAECPLEGNMLAIFTDGRGLSDAEMQALARETNLAETTFYLPAQPGDREDEARVRIFTTREELPFAGHPTLGTAAWLYWNHPALKGSEAITLRLNSGPVTVRFDRPRDGEVGVHGTMRQKNPVFGPMHDPAEVMRVLGLGAGDLDERYPVQTVSTGLPFCIVPFRTLEAIGRLRIPQAAAQAYLDAHQSKFFYCLAPAAEGSGAEFRARMQFYSGEDPATGSAAGCAISYLVRHGIVASGQPEVFEQGVEIGRASRIYVNASLHDGEISNVFVGGRTIAVAKGRFFLPAR